MAKFLGWRMWFLDGTSAIGSTWDEAVSVAEEHPHDVLIRMIYFDNGQKEIQMGLDHYFASPHSSGEVIYGANNLDPEIIKERYPGAVIQYGVWAPHDFYKQVCGEATSSTWNEEYK